MFTVTRRRTEAGEGAVSILLAAVLGTMVIGGFSAFWLASHNNAARTAEFTSQESATIQALNRAGRDIQDATAILHADARVLVLEKRAAKHTGQAPTRTRFTIADGAVVQQTWTDAPETYDPTGWDAVETTDQPCADDATQACQVVTTAIKEPGTLSRFAYVDIEGDTLTGPMDATAARAISRVDIKVTAAAGTGEVSLESSAAVDVATAATVATGPQCPTGITLPVTTQVAGEPAPLVSWQPVTGASQYVVQVNGAEKTRQADTTWTGVPSDYAPGVSYFVSVGTVAADGTVSGMCTAGEWTKVGPEMPTPGVFAARAWAEAYSVNTVEWDKPAGADPTGYRVDKRRHDTAGSWTTAAASLPASARSWDDVLVAGAPDTANQSQLGTTYEYRVVALGVNATSDTAYVTQFPPDPVTTALGSYRPAPGAADPLKAPTHLGSNQVTWTAAKSATRYKMRRYEAEVDPATGFMEIVTDGKPVLVNALAYADTGQPRGTERFYRSSAVNSCTRLVDDQVAKVACESPVATEAPMIDALAVAYQAPAAAATVMNAADRPSLATNQFTVRRAAAETVDQAAIAEGARAYCRAADARAECEYRLRVRNSVVTTETNPTKAYFDERRTPWGSSDWVAVQRCNSGGCSPIGTVPSDDSQTTQVKWVHQYPGFFNVPIARRHLRDEYLLHEYAKDEGRQTSHPAGMQIPWTTSAGVKTGRGAYEVKWVEVANSDPNNVAGVRAADETERAFPRVEGAWVRTTPGATYDVTVTATAPNGLQRPVTKRVQIAPPAPVFFQTGTFCNPAQNDNGWKAAFRYANHGKTPNTTDATNKDWVLRDQFDGYSLRWFRGRAPLDRKDDMGKWFWEQISGQTMTPDGSNWNPGTWGLHERTWATFLLDKTTATVSDELLGRYSSTRMMDNTVRSGGTMTLNAYQNVPSTTDVADPYSRTMLVSIWKVATGPVQCGDTGTAWQWNGNLVAIHRHAYPGIGGDWEPRKWDEGPGR